MSESAPVELSERQRELLLQGLRYVRSSVKLDIDDLPTAEKRTKRESRLEEIASLVDHLTGSPAAHETSEVS